MTNTLAIRVAAILGFLAVALGAFCAHGLKDTLTQHGTTAIWEKAVLYHFIHTIMLFVLGQRRPVLAGAWLGFLAGPPAIGIAADLQRITAAAAVGPHIGRLSVRKWPGHDRSGDSSSKHADPVAPDVHRTMRSV